MIHKSLMFLLIRVIELAKTQSKEVFCNQQNRHNFASQCNTVNVHSSVDRILRSIFIQYLSPVTDALLG